MSMFVKYCPPEQDPESDSERCAFEITAHAMHCAECGSGHPILRTKVEVTLRTATLRDLGGVVPRAPHRKGAGFQPVLKIESAEHETWEDLVREAAIEEHPAVVHLDAKCPACDHSWRARLVGTYYTQRELDELAEAARIERGEKIPFEVEGSDARGNSKTVQLMALDRDEARMLAGTSEHGGLYATRIRRLDGST